MRGRVFAVAAVVMGCAAAGFGETAIAGPGPGPAAPSAARVLANVQHAYAGADRLTAQFEQTVTIVAFGQTKTTAGKLWVMRPARFRWDYVRSVRGTTRVNKSFVYDGATLWLIDHLNRQLVRHQTAGGPLPAAVSFLTDSSQLVTQFRVAFAPAGKYGGKGDVVLELTPKRPSAQYDRLYFVIDRARWEVRASIVIDSAGNTNQFRFRGASTAAKVNPRWFRVSPSALPRYKLVTVGGGGGRAGAGAGAGAGSSAGAGAKP